MEIMEIMEIKIMGPGCPNCDKLSALINEVVAESGVTAEVRKVTDFQEMAMAGVLSTPALTINGEVKCVGRLPSKDEIAAWLK